MQKQSKQEWLDAIKSTASTAMDKVKEFAKEPIKNSKQQDIAGAVAGGIGGGLVGAMSGNKLALRNILLGMFSGAGLGYGASKGLSKVLPKPYLDEWKPNLSPTQRDMIRKPYQNIPQTTKPENMNRELVRQALMEMVNKSVDKMG
jgi:hypothetical protein